MVITRKKDTKDIYSIVRSVDPNAFISEASVMGVYGKGFETIKKQ